MKLQTIKMDLKQDHMVQPLQTMQKAENEKLHCTLLKFYIGLGIAFLICESY